MYKLNYQCQFSQLLKRVFIFSHQVMVRGSKTWKDIFWLKGKGN